MKSISCEYCTVLAKACKSKDKEIQRLHNKIKHLIQAKARMARRLNGVSIPKVLQ